MGSRRLENCRGGMRNVLDGEKYVVNRWNAARTERERERERRLEFAFHSTSSAALFSLNESPLPFLIVLYLIHLASEAGENSSSRVSSCVFSFLFRPDFSFLFLEN